MLIWTFEGNTDQTFVTLQRKFTQPRPNILKRKYFNVIFVKSKSGAKKRTLAKKKEWLFR